MTNVTYYHFYKCASIMIINVIIIFFQDVLSLHLINYILSSGIFRIITFILRYAWKNLNRFKSRLGLSMLEAGNHFQFITPTSLSRSDFHHHFYLAFGKIPFPYVSDKKAQQLHSFGSNTFLEILIKDNMITLCLKNIT